VVLGNQCLEPSGLFFENFQKDISPLAGKAPLYQSVFLTQGHQNFTEESSFEMNKTFHN
jgi:hypothetical protein